MDVREIPLLHARRGEGRAAAAGSCAAALLGALPVNRLPPAPSNPTGRRFVVRDASAAVDRGEPDRKGGRGSAEFCLAPGGRSFGFGLREARRRLTRRKLPLGCDILEPPMPHTPTGSCTRMIPRH